MTIPARAILSTVFAAGLAVASVGTGAQAPAPVGAASASAMTPAERHDWERSHRVGHIIGTDVRDTAGEKIGEIRDLVVDASGTIRLAIVSTGGFLGVGDRLLAVPWDLLSLGDKDDRVLDIDKTRLKAAPGFTSKTWPNLGDERWLADNRRHYVH